MPGSLTRALGTGLALSALFIAAACRGRAADGISRELYIDTYVEILRTADKAPDSLAAFDSARAILERRGIGEQDLLDFARQHIRDADYLSEVWLEIERRLKAPPDSAPKRAPPMDDEG